MLPLLMMFLVGMINLMGDDYFADGGEYVDINLQMKRLRWRTFIPFFALRHSERALKLSLPGMATSLALRRMPCCPTINTYIGLYKG